MEISDKLKKLPTIKLSQVNNLQGDLKDLSEQNYNRLINRIEKVGFKYPLYLWLNPKDNKYYNLDGNQRQRAILKHFGDIEVPYIEIQAENEKEAKKEILAISSQYGKVTKDGFDEFTFDFETEDFEDVKNEMVWDFMMDEEVEEIEAEEDDFDEEPPAIPITVLGDLYEIGEHRLLCGDSTDSDHVEKLMNGEKAEMVVTDPPYGVNYDPKWREGLEHQRKGTSNGDVILNDNQTDWSVVYSLFDSNVVYVWHPSNKTIEFGQSLIDSGYELKYLIVWNKDLMVLGRGDYHWKHELLWYAVKKGENHNWQGDRKQTTVWDIPTIHSFKNGKNKDDWGLVGHSCQKPLLCMIKPIENNSKTNDLIADPFLGSGSTMVASHRLKRKCYGMELDPKYCDVIVKRMRKLDESIIIKCNGVDITTAEWVNSF